MPKKVKTIAIVGGGSAGWMSAATLSKFLPDCNITVIESPNIPRVGVGESTLGQIRNWLYHLDIKEEDFITEVDGSYKLGIKFTDFYKKDGGYFFYPFGVPYVTESSVFHLNTWQVKKHYYPETAPDDYARTWYSGVALMESNKFYDNFDGALQNFRPDIHVAYHFDAIKFADWLKNVYCFNSGVEVLSAEVANIKTSENGIESLVLDNGEEFSADLYVDCTGFKSLLLGDALEEPFESYDDILPNNRAWATQIPYTDKEKEMEPYTNCTAIGNGWVWNIPSWSRIGTGYVYSDKYTSPEEALEEFKAHLDSDKMTVPDSERSKSLEFRELRFKPGIHKKTWVKNVVAIGLSAGFIEPLESNGLFTVHEFLIKLVKSLDRGEVTQWDRDVYNYSTKTMFDDFAQFVALHYALSGRDDTPYWQDINEREYNRDGIVERNPNLTNGFYRLAERKMFLQEHAQFTGMACIANGMNYSLVEGIAISAWELHYDREIDKRLETFLAEREDIQKKWKEVVDAAPTLFEYLADKYHPEERKHSPENPSSTEDK